MFETESSGWICCSCENSAEGGGATWPPIDVDIGDFGEFARDWLAEIVNGQ